MPKAHVTDISQLPVFDEISPADCTLLFDCLGCRIREYKKDCLIRLERELAGNVGTVIEGSVNMYKQDIWGNRTLVSYMQAGHVFGETFSLSEITPEHEGVFFVTASPSLILFLPASRILHPCKNSCPFHHQLTKNMFSMISAKNRRLMERIEVSSQGSVREKILAYLSMEAQRQGRSSFRLPLRRTEMAEYLCINRSAMSRELTALRDEGVIDFDRNYFTLRFADPKE